MKVKVLQPFQVCHDGAIHRPGKTAEVPDHVGELWLASGWVDEVGGRKRKAGWVPQAVSEAGTPVVDEDGRPVPPAGDGAPVDE
ncbi:MULTISPECIES: hypothetical protein [Mycobacterium]|uniref:Uncharacterized protein n=1 Tax=Mycobacterium kiyosense TaxID=2871094 RepID=A0A9P3QCN5_9MYCO|nr:MULTISPECIES: hypothetical protein [Mycobacterium]BDB42833.1 hypothetical protein IWGMT90018_32790 [Mycobacterium kiyosense]BDE13928.1 hypothetical protein MKCMC460_27880 [Mycobacterium sp. 20KCMC460]GLB84620.1 hypothetical protein SRL2020028_38760 [Mycobacterium kiyosense]GLB91929.1 hypothetical protein SRL2020130_47460 [Mycobacterium kiyosense]GLB97968.1 hypothetical protein SRL2020226_47440 [Mycobacterium kiyosense]